MALPTPTRLSNISILRDGGSLRASFHDGDGNYFRLLLKVRVKPTSTDINVVGYEPWFERRVPHLFTDKFMGGQHGYETSESVSLAWEDAGFLLARLAQLPPEHPEERDAEHLARMARIIASRGAIPETPAASLEQLLQSTAEVLFPEDADAVVTLASRAEDGDSPLHVVLWRKDEAGARRLAEAGADVDAAGDLQDTPLHVAIRLKLADAVAMLLAAGANPDAPNLFGDTPRAAAYKQGGAMADCFRTAGLDPPLFPLPPVDAPE